MIHCGHAGLWWKLVWWTSRSFCLQNIAAVDVAWWCCSNIQVGGASRHYRACVLAVLPVLAAGALYTEGKLWCSVNHASSDVFAGWLGWLIAASPDTQHTAYWYIEPTPTDITISLDLTISYLHYSNILYCRRARGSVRSGDTLEVIRNIYIGLGCHMRWPSCGRHTSSAWNSWWVYTIISDIPGEGVINPLRIKGSVHRTSRH